MRINTKTYDATCKQKNGSQGVNHRHDESRDGRDPDGGNAHEGDEHGKAARKSRKGGRCRHRASGLPFCGADGKAEDDGSEEELKRAGDEGGEHFEGV